jgi:hypothetical protein
MVRGLGDFQRAQAKRRDDRIDLLFSHLRSALDCLQDIMTHPYQPPSEPAARRPEPPTPAPEPTPIAHPAYASIGAWCALSGMNRSATYSALGRGDLSAVKVGRSTKIDVAAGLAWLRSRPAAKFSPPRQ